MESSQSQQCLRRIVRLLVFAKVRPGIKVNASSRGTTAAQHCHVTTPLFSTPTTHPQAFPRLRTLPINHRLRQFPAHGTHRFPQRRLPDGDTQAIKPLPIAIIVVARDHVPGARPLTETTQHVIFIVVVTFVTFFASRLRPLLRTLLHDLRPR